MRISEAERFVFVPNSEAEPVTPPCAQLLERLNEEDQDGDAPGATKPAELRGVISTKAGLHRFLPATPGALVRIGTTAIAAEAKLNGKYR